MVQSNSSERVEKNNGSYAKFPVARKVYQVTKFVVSVERVSHRTNRSLLLGYNVIVII